MLAIIINDTHFLGYNYRDYSHHFNYHALNKKSFGMVAYNIFYFNKTINDIENYIKKYEA